MQLIHEDFIGVHPLKDTGVDHIVVIIKVQIFTL